MSEETSRIPSARPRHPSNGAPCCGPSWSGCAAAA